jgi:2'-5' RNA ligase
MEKIRAFIAIELPRELKEALAGLQGRLKSGGPAPVKWVDPGSMHLTLKFLGNIDSGITGRISGAMQGAVQGISPFHVQVKDLGVFPDPRRVRVIWVGLTGDIEKLSRLQQNIESALKPLGFTPENRPFAPHLTLARVRDGAAPAERQKLGQLVVATGFDNGYRLDVNSVDLMKSQLTREGPIYTRLASVVLE